MGRQARKEHRWKSLTTQVQVMALPFPGFRTLDQSLLLSEPQFPQPVAWRY